MKNGIAALMNDQQFNLVPEGLARLDRREKYESDPSHSSLKDKRDKRDELKEKKFNAQQTKQKPAAETNAETASAKE
jgi:lysine 2,3-aminomutase